MKLAIIGPNFFSYVQGVAKRFEARGVATRFFDCRYSNSNAAKIYYRFGIHKLIVAPRNHHMAGIIRQIIATGHTHVLGLNAEGLSPAHIRQLQAAGVKVFFFSWDSIANKPDYVKAQPLVDGMGTFDPVDAERFGLRYIPLFADHVFSARRNGASAPRDIDLSFCGTLHSNRASLLKRFVERLPGANVDLKIFIHSRAIYLARALVSPAALTFRRVVSESSFSREAIADSLFRSKYVLDMPHPQQAGLTARTFEALRGGARLVTFNRNATMLPAPFHDRLIIVDAPEEATGLDLEAAPLPPLTVDEDYYLSIDRFVDDLAEMMGSQLPPATQSHFGLLERSA